MRQVPDGLYRIDSLNPNSLYHLALHVDYPSADDRARAAQDGRRELGGAIMIHGGAGSDRCLAMGDEAAEDLFVRAGAGRADRPARAPRLARSAWRARVDRRALRRTARRARHAAGSLRSVAPPRRVRLASRAKAARRDEAREEPPIRRLRARRAR